VPASFHARRCFDGRWVEKFCIPLPMGAGAGHSYASLPKSDVWPNYGVIMYLISLISPKKESNDGVATPPKTFGPRRGRHHQCENFLYVFK
jgi:hypothetical protein